MKKITIIFSLVFFVCIALVLLLQIDDDINPEAQQAYDQVTAQSESKAYIYFLGMLAAVDEQPKVLGEKIYKSFQKAQKSGSFDQALNYSYQYPEEKKLPRFELSSKKENYAEKIFSQQFDSTTLSKEQQTLLERYKEFMSLGDFHTLAKPSLNAPLDTYWYLTSGNDLFLLHAIESAKKGQLNEAKKSIQKNLGHARIQLKNADNLIGKIIYIKILSDNLDVLSSLIHQYKIPFKGNIAPLTAAEKDFTQSLNREFSMQYVLYKSLDGSSDLLKNNTYDSKIPAWVARILFKPNMSINTAYPQYRYFVERSRLPPEEFAKVVNNPPEEVKSQSSFRNKFGFILATIGLPDFNNYSARGFYLDGKIEIFNQTANQVILPENLDHIQNPFYKDKAAFYDKSRRQICFDGPLSTNVKKHQRCLSISVNK